MIFFLYFPSLLFVFFIFLQYNFCKSLNLSEKVLIFLTFSSDFLFSVFWLFFVTLFLFNFFILFFYLFKFIFVIALILLKFVVFKLFAFFFLLNSFSVQFIIGSHGFWRHLSFGIFPHFLTYPVFLFMFVYYICILIYLGQYLENFTIKIDDDLGTINSKEFNLYMKNQDDSDSWLDHDLINMEAWISTLNHPYTIFNYEDPEICGYLESDLLESLTEVIYLSKINKSNLSFHYELSQHFKKFNFIKKKFFFFFNKFFKIENSWKFLIDLFFFFIYVPCLVYTLIKLLFFFYEKNLK